jgi:hypothetical protein
VDFELRDAGGGMGLGYFALRDFAVGEKVLVERCVLRFTLGDKIEELGGARKPPYLEMNAKFGALPACTQAAISALYQPPCISFEDKILSQNCPIWQIFRQNSYAIDSSDANVGGLFIHGSRFNHSCFPNCSRIYVEDQGLMVFSACIAIAAGTELTVCYSDPSTIGLKGFDGYREYMIKCWGFQCTCPSCSDLSIFTKLEMIAKLMDQMSVLSTALANRSKPMTKVECRPKIYQFIKIGKEAIKLVEDLGLGFSNHHLKLQIYSYVFPWALHQQSTLKLAHYCALKSLECLEVQMGGSRVEPAQLVQARMDVTFPERRPAYLRLDRL